MTPIYIAIVVSYVLVMLAVGFWSMKRTKDVGDFFLGGRTLGPWMSAFAFGTTYFSAVLFIGYAGKLGWGFGIHTMWIVIGNTLIGTLLAWALLAGRTREMTTRLNAITMPEFLHARFGSKGLQVIAALVIFVFLVPYSASVMMGMTYLFQNALHFQPDDYAKVLYFLTALTAVYLIMGGYFAVAISDFIRGIVEFGGVMLMVYLLVEKVGGFASATHALLTNPANAPAIAAPAKTLGAGALAVPSPGWLTLAALVFITSFGPWALPQMVQKFYSIRRKADVKRIMIIAGIFALFMSFGAYYSGALAHLFYQNGLPSTLLGPPDAQGHRTPIWDMIMPHFITNAGLPPALVLIIVLMVFSASMSSLSSLVLVSSSAIAVDFIGAFRNRQANQRQTMALLRALCAVFVGLSLYIALHKPTFIVNLMVIAWGTLGGVFMAPFLYGLFWKRTTVAGVYAGIGTGLASAGVLFVAWGADGVPLAGAITMILPMIVVPIVSLLTPPLPTALVDAAFTDTPADALHSKETVPS